MLARNPGGEYSTEHQQRIFLAGLEALKQEKQAALEIKKALSTIFYRRIYPLSPMRPFKAISPRRFPVVTIRDAVIKAAMEFCEILNRSSSKYIKERTGCSRYYRTITYCDLWPGILPQNSLELTQPSIILANSLTPSQFLGINKEFLAGMVLSATGKTSHTAILARSLGIPTLTDIDFSTLQLNTEMDIIIDGNPGILIIAPDEKVLRYYQNEIAVQQSMQQQMLANVYQAATTSDHHSIEIAANIASPAEAEAAFSNGAEGIGLFRTEMSFMDRESAPDYHELAELYSQ